MGLANALFLAAAAAVAIPVIIHMTRSRKYRHVTIGTLRFLESVVRESRRVRRIENWPLLLLRIAIVSLIALLFARPFIKERDKDDAARSETLVLLDSSGSLAGEGSEAVREIVKEIEKDLPPESMLTLVEFSDQARLIDSLDDYQPKAGAPTDYVEAVDWTIERLQAAEQQSTKVIFVSDLQQSSLPSAPPRLWPGSARVEVQSVPVAGEWNACVERVDLVTPYLAEEVALEARIKIFGPIETPPTKATLLLEGAEPLEINLPTPRGGRVTFRWNPGEQTEFRGRVRLVSDDAWPADNERPFLFRLRKQKRILLIDGDPGATPFLGEAYFVEKAINASGASHGQSPFRTELRQGLTNKNGVLDLSEWDAIVCCNLAGFSGPEARALAEASRSGCGLLFALGEQAAPAAYRPLQTVGLFPKQFDLTESAVPRLVTEWDLRHAALQRFETTDLRRVLLRNAFQFDPDQNWQALASFEPERPVLLARRAAGPPVLVFANPLNREWSELPVNRIYVPLMREWASHLTGLEQAAAEIRLREPGLDEARAPGVYSGEDGLVDVVAAQPLEMDPAVTDLPTFRTALAIPEPSLDFVPEPPGAPKERERPNEWWPWIVIVLIGLLITENYMSDRSKSVLTNISSPRPHEA